MTLKSDVYYINTTLKEFIASVDTLTDAFQEEADVEDQNDEVVLILEGTTTCKMNMLNSRKGIYIKMFNLKVLLITRAGQIEMGKAKERMHSL